MNPFLVLDVALDVSDDEVRAAYQRLVRRYPPERHPRQFQQIQEAYQMLRSERERWRWCLLNLPEETGRAGGPLEVLADFAALPGRMRPPGAAALRTLLRGCGSAAMRDATMSATAPAAAPSTRRPPKR